MIKLYQFIHSSIFVITIVSVGIVSLANKPLDMNAIKETTVLNGETARALETNYDEKLSIKQFAVNLWAAVEYRLFNEGKQGLVIGKEGWLYTDEEFKSSEKSQWALQNNLSFIKWINKEFSKRHVNLIIVPVPAKARVYADKLNKDKPDNLHINTYQVLLTELRAASVHVADSYQAMQRDKKSHAQFLKTDTHWTPDGAKAVANHAAQYITNKTKMELVTSEYVTERKQTKELKGDLFNYLPLSPWFEDLLPDSDQITLYQTYQASDEAVDDLFAETSDTVALVGTSYSANPNWNFEGALKQALSTDIINYAEEGQGPIKPMMRFLQTYETEMPDLKLVIWEIPERYLSVAYQDVYAKREAMEINDTLIAKEFKPTLNL